MGAVWGRTEAHGVVGLSSGRKGRMQDKKLQRVGREEFYEKNCGYWFGIGSPQGLSSF